MEILRGGWRRGICIRYLGARGNRGIEAYVFFNVFTVGNLIARGALAVCFDTHMIFLSP